MSNQQVNMIRHDDPDNEFVVPQLDPFVDRVHNNLRNIRSSKIGWAVTATIQLPIQPDKGLAGS